MSALPVESFLVLWSAIVIEGVCEMYGLDEIIRMNSSEKFIKEHTRPGTSWLHPGGVIISFKGGNPRRRFNPACRIHEAPNKV